MNPSPWPEIIEKITSAIALVREQVRIQRETLSDHVEFRPDFDSYERRLDEILELVRNEDPEDFVHSGEIFEDLLLDLEADSATIKAEISMRLVRFVDELDAEFQEKKFEMPSEARDRFEEMMQPYYDGIREDMLGEVPIEMRREVEEAKRRLSE